MNEAVRQKAGELARLIRFSPEYISMKAAEDAASQEEALRTINALYEDKRREVEQLTLQDDPDYSQIMAANRELEEIRAQYNAHPLAQAVNMSRRDFTNMMNMVNQILQQALNPEGTPGKTGCSGSCAGCSGCS